MRVLEVLQEQEKPLRLINPDELDITNPEEKKLKINNPSAAPANDDAFNRRAKRLGVTQANLDNYNKKKSAGADKKWQNTAFSQSAWYLIFYMANFNDFADASEGYIKSQFEYWFKRLVTLPKANTTSQSWAGDANRFANIFLTNQNSVEGIIAELRGRVKNTFGITIHNNWEPNADGMSGLKTNYKDFGDKFVSIMGAPAIVPNYGKQSNVQVTQKDRDDIPELTDKKAGEIAAKLENEFSKVLTNPFSSKEDEAILLIITSNIKVNHQWDKLVATYNKMYPKKDFMERLLKDLNDEFEVKLSKHLNQIGSGALPNSKDISSYSEKRDGFEFRTAKELKAEVKNFQKQFVEKEPKFGKFIETKDGASIWRAFMDDLMKDLEKQFKKNNSLTLSALKETWMKRIEAFKASANNYS